jgi:outer membrane protein assembly factor BamB
MKHLSLLIAILLFACSKREIPLPNPVLLKPAKIITQLDSIFFTNVSLFTDDERIYILNQNPAFIAATDKNFNLLWIRNEEGNGPSDLYYPEQVNVIKEKLYILDHGNQSLKQFEKKTGNFISSLKIPEPVQRFRFDLTQDEHALFTVFNSVNHENVIKVDRNGEVIKKFGTTFPERPGPNRQMKYFQLDGNGNLILIGASLPYVELLDQEGESINRFDLSKYEPIKRSLDSLEVTVGEAPRNTIPTIITDAQYKDGKLYASFTDRIGLDRTKARNLLVFRLNERDCELEAIYKFQTGTDDDNFNPKYFHVDAIDKKLYVQGLVTRYIYVFDLPDS